MQAAWAEICEYRPDRGINMGCPLLTRSSLMRQAYRKPAAARGNARCVSVDYLTPSAICAE